MGEVLNAMMAIVCIVVGLPLCFAGYRLFRASNFTIAFVSGGGYLGPLLSYLIHGISDDPTGYWLIRFGSGLLCGVIAVFHAKSGICVTGFCGGSNLAILVIGMANYGGSYESQLIWMGVAGVVCAILTSILKKPALVLASSLVGARLFTDGIYYFIWEAAIKKAFAGYINNDFVNDIRTKWWILCVVSLALFATGVLVQFQMTGQGNYHETQQQEQQGDEGNSSTVQYVKAETPVQTKAYAAGEPIAIV